MTPHLYESHIKEKFLTAMNQVLANSKANGTADKTNQNADPKTKHNANKK